MPFEHSYVSINPHLMLDDAGAVRTVDDKPVCLFCHAVMPDPGPTGRRPFSSGGCGFSVLALPCREDERELFNHHFLRKVPRKTKKLMKASEQKHDVILPMQPRNRLTCSTCHNRTSRGHPQCGRGEGAGARHQLVCGAMISA